MEIYFFDFLLFSWNNVCFWFNKLWWSVPHLCVTPVDPTMVKFCQLLRPCNHQCGLRKPSSKTPSIQISLLQLPSFDWAHIDFLIHLQNKVKTSDPSLKHGREDRSPWLHLVTGQGNTKVLLCSWISHGWNSSIRGFSCTFIFFQPLEAWLFLLCWG